MARLVKMFFASSLLCFCMAVKAQLTTYTLPFAGYEYQNQSFGDVGLRLLFVQSDNILYRVSASALLGEVDDKMSAMPKVQGDVLLNFEKNVDIFHSWYFLLGLESTNKFFTPRVGFSLFGILDLTGGYGVNYGRKLTNGKELKGFNLNFTLNIPTVIFSGKK